MPKSSKPILAGIPWDTLTEPKVLVRIGLGFLLAANLAAAAFAFHLFDASPEDVGRQLTSALETQRQEQLRLVRSRLLAATVEKGKAEGAKFLATSMTSRRRTYSTILRELTETAKTAGMEKAGGSINLQPVAGSEDETGAANIVVRPDVWQAADHAVRRAAVLVVHGRIQRRGQVVHILATSLEPLTLATLPRMSRDFC